MRVPRRRPAATADAPGKRFRPDIEGLRAFAVLLVVLDHMKLWPHGGFVGVDVFFAISGFLITGLVVDEIGRSGRFSVANFYRRRARRILPAALVTLAGSGVIAALLFTHERVVTSLHDIGWALGFAANIHFAHGHTDYFSTYAPPSIVQHYWSLAVEEQFYVVWPLVLLVVFLLVRRRRSRPLATTQALTALAAVATVVSLAWCIYETATSPTSAYFSTPARAWELTAGATVALLARLGWRIPSRLAGPLSLAGVVGVVASGGLVTSSGFPGYIAVLPVLASCLVLASGVHQTRILTVWRLPLTNVVARYVGRVSFSLYLVHWPVIIAANTLYPHRSVEMLLATAAAMAAATLASYYLVETRFHHAASQRPPSPSPLRSPLWAIPALAVVAGVLFAAAPTSQPQHLNLTASAVSGPQGAALQQQLISALKASSWPRFNPDLETVLSYKEFDDQAACGDSVTMPPASSCTVGDPKATKVAYVVGNSLARAEMQTLKHFASAGRTHWRIRYIGMSGCEFVDARIDNPVTWIADACPARRQAAVDVILHDHPDLVIVTNNFGVQVDATTGQPMSTQQWSDAQERYVAKFRAAVKQVALLTPPAAEADIHTCYSKVGSPADCLSHVTPQRAQVEAAVRAIAARQGDIYVDSDPWFCVNGTCPAFVGVIPTKKDVVHPSIAYANAIAPAALESFQAQGLFL